jgi:hypothetical protein
VFFVKLRSGHFESRRLGLIFQDVSVYVDSEKKQSKIARQISIRCLSICLWESGTAWKRSQKYDHDVAKRKEESPNDKGQPRSY